MLGFISSRGGLAAGLLVLVCGILWLGLPRAALAENLPVTVQRYTQACEKTGGALTNNLGSGGSGVIYCLWASRGERTECKVGAFQVNRCGIRCRSDACYNANPEKDMPTWPLSGGPSRKNMPVDTLAPGQLAPVN